MSPPKKIALLPYLAKEVFNIHQPIHEYIKRNKLVAGLFISCVILFISFLFAKEQVIKLSNKPVNTALVKEVSELQKKLEAYQSLNKDLEMCKSELINKPIPIITNSNCSDNQPNPQPVNRKNKETAILNRVSEDTLKKKLEAIRVEGE